MKLLGKDRHTRYMGVAFIAFVWLHLFSNLLGKVLQHLLVALVALTIRVAQKKWPDHFQKHSESCILLLLLILLILFFFVEI